MPDIAFKVAPHATDSQHSHYDPSRLATFNNGDSRFGDCINAASRLCDLLLTSVLATVNAVFRFSHSLAELIVQK